MIAPLPDEDVAAALERVATLLEAQDADAFRVRAYRSAAWTIRHLDRPLHEILAEDGVAGLQRLPGIGRSIAASVRELVHTGRLALLDRLEGQASPEDLFTTVPGVGDELAHRIHEGLGIRTLEDLEIAAHDGRLAALEGFGERRVQGIRDALAGILGRSGRLRAHRARLHERTPDVPPPVGLLLEIDELYRQRAEAGALRRIAPRRFNPRGEAWLPILHHDRGGWSFTALYSNTALAHRVGAVRDWVVVFAERDGAEVVSTVVTERQGPLAGRRVVRGREAECARHHGPPEARTGAS